jgi:tetratricopeptide (TPR) repeat protein
MKKIMIMALMAAAATTAFAQDDLVKEAKNLCGKGEFDKAAEVLTPALTSAATTDKAKAWNQMVDIQYGKFTGIQTTDMENKVKQIQAPYDTLGMHKACAESFLAALKCDEFDRQPNEKGKVKIRFRQANQQRMQNVRLSLINAGQYMYKVKDLANAFKYWSLYVDSSKDPFFEGIDMTKDQYRSEIAYYAALAAYFQKDYPNAEKYADIAAQDPEKANDANEILLFAAKENMKTPADSAAYLKRIKDLHQAKPEEERYFNLLMDYYTHKNDMNALKAWAEEEIAMNSQNKMAWALKGEVQMNNNEWDAAVESYKKAIEVDPEFVQCVFNAGVCLNSKAIALNDQLADKKTGGLTKDNAEKVKSVLRDAQGFLERARELDGDQLKVKWAYPLYRIYYSLQMKDKMAELEAIDPSLAQ